MSINRSLKFVVWFVLLAAALVMGGTQSMPALAEGGEIFVVTTTEDSGAGSLRQAILDANAHPGPDTIAFNIASAPDPSGMYVILLDSLLPPVTETVTIDGTSQRGYLPRQGPIVEINGAQLDKSCAGVESGIYRDHAGLDVTGVGASGTTVQGLKLSNFCEAISISANVPTLQSGCPGDLDARIANVTVQENVMTDNPGGNAALDLCNVAHSKLQRNRFSRSGDHMEITRSEYIVVTENEGRDSQDAIELIGGEHITIADNRFSDNRRNGIVLVFGAKNSHILGNEISNMAASGLILSDNNNVVQGNKIAHVGWFGIEVRHGSGNIVSENTVKHSGVAGIVVSAARFDGLGDCTVDDDGNPVNCGFDFNLGKGDALDNVISNNTVAFNNGPGILVGGTYVEPDGTVRMATGNSLLGNTIYGNAGLGIDLSDEMQHLYFATEEPIVGLYGDIVIAAPDGPTPNDSGILANHGQNAPVLTSARVEGQGRIVQGSIDAPNPQTVTVELFANRVPKPGGDPAGYGEGAEFLGSVTPDAQGAFTALVAPVPVGTLITATATDAEGNTSEFAANISVRSGASQ
jgi:parallel beta-helix repeat protein